MPRIREPELDGSQPALIVTYGNTTHKHRPLDRDVILLGRGRGCDFVLVSPEIAPVHCLVVRASSGWLIRDGGSRAGTHVNGEPITETLLQDGDTVQIGPFCFRVQLPAFSSWPPAQESAQGAGMAGERTAAHLRRSRRNLARLALGLRRRLRAERLPRQPDQMARALQERLCECEQRAEQLSQAERELAVDRDILEQEFNALQERVLRTEQELARRQANFDAELRARWQAFQKLCQEAEQAHARWLEQSASGTPDRAAEARRLDLRRQELDSYARYLSRTRRQLSEQAKGLEEPRGTAGTVRQAISHGTAADAPDIAGACQQTS
jgi:hypothetical protein